MLRFARHLHLTAVIRRADSGTLRTGPTSLCSCSICRGLVVRRTFMMRIHSVSLFGFAGPADEGAGPEAGRLLQRAKCRLRCRRLCACRGDRLRGGDAPRRWSLRPQCCGRVRSHGRRVQASCRLSSQLHWRSQRAAYPLGKGRAVAQPTVPPIPHRSIVVCNVLCAIAVPAVGQTAWQSIALCSDWGPPLRLDAGHNLHFADHLLPRACVSMGA